MLSPDLVLDGYRLIREIGRGGFGEVWLCRLEATGEYKALKFLSANDADSLERELEALIRYRAVVVQAKSANLVPIEHVNRTASGLFYTMPLADGQDDSEGCSPEDPAWRPKTLDSLIQHQRGALAWFTVDEIRAILLPLLNAVQRLSDAGVVHRDIKPENILFIEGCPCLGDVSLLSDDTATLTRRGTPGYAAPSWYVESGGDPDQWGMATTFYSLLTGNAPDKVGRAAFLWPPQGEQSVDRSLWKALHGIILRATHEKPSERFLRFDALAEALQGLDLRPVQPWHSGWRWIAVSFLLLMLIGFAVQAYHPSHPRSEAPAALRQSATAPVRPELEKELNIFKAEFDALLKEGRAAIYVNTPEDKVSTKKLNSILERLNKQSGVTFGDLQQALDEIEKLAPSLEVEFRPLDRSLYQKYVHQALVMAHKVENLATTAEDEVHTQWAYKEMRKKLEAFDNYSGPHPPGEKFGSRQLEEKYRYEKMLNPIVENAPWTPGEKAAIQQRMENVKKTLFAGAHAVGPPTIVPASKSGMPPKFVFPSP